MYEYMDTNYRDYHTDTNQWERNMFQLVSPPQPMDTWQDYIDLVKQDGDDNAFVVFLHYYEPTINAKVQVFAERYALQSHFGDLKMAYVETLWSKLQDYPKDCSTPFLKFVKQAVSDAMHAYGALNLKGFTTTQDKQYYKLRTAAYIYKTKCYADAQLAIPMICEHLHMSEKTAKRLLEEVQVLDTFLWFEEKWDKEDYEGPPDGQDVMGLLKPHLPEPALLRKETRKHLRRAFHNLCYRDQDIVSRHLGFYKVCFRPLFSVSFEDLADIHQFSTADGVRKAYKQALAKMRVQMEYWELMESVRVKCVKKTAERWQFAYRPMDAGEPGLIEFTVREGKPVAYRIVEAAENDDEDQRFGREAAGQICNLARKDALPKEEVLILRDGDLLPLSYK